LRLDELESEDSAKQSYRARFREVTRRAQCRFEPRHWAGALGDAPARLGLYAQAQGQYRQALLVRIAGKRPNV